METFVCVKCGLTKNITEFRAYKRKTVKSGIKDYHEHACKSCRHKQVINNPNRKLTAEKHRASPKGQIAARRNVVARYGLTLEEYDAMVEAADGVCEICKQPEIRMHKGRVKFLSVDHCHNTNVVRGILCDNCNTALGRVKDSVETLEAMIEYLRRSKL